MDDVEALTAEVRDRVATLGFELVDLRAGGTSGRTRLQLRVDRPDSTPGHGVTIDDCASVSRALEQWLDQSSRLGPRYVLEVSSPGIERPIRWREHWERFAGHDVRARLPGRGRTHATIVRVEGDAVTLRPVDGTPEVTLPLGEIRDATLVVDWDGARPHD